jgi:DNA-binding NarL/FixJ family response regulator
VGTVKVHVTAILKALGVKNRTQAVLAAGEMDRTQAT